MKKSPLIIIGIDAGDPQLLERWAGDGTMPNLNKIMNSGCWGHTSGRDLLFEHGSWLSISSGVSRREHGYHHYRQLKPQTYELELVTGDRLGVPPFWSTLQGTGTKCAIIDVPETSPLPDLSGIQLSDWAVHDPQSLAAAHPPDLLADVKRQFGKQIIVHEQYDSDLETDLVIYQELMERVEKKGSLCRHLLAGDDFDLVFAVFAEAHTGAHQFWGYRSEAQGLQKVPPPNPLMHAVHDIYQAIDREIGMMLDQLPKEANVFIVSSVGLLDHFPMGGLIEDFCFKLGYQIRPAQNEAPLSLLGIGRKLIPESLRIEISKRMLSREARERIVSDQFHNGTDWTRTTAFTTPSTFMSFLWVNLRGRQPQGFVNPGSEYQELLDQLTADLQLLIDPQTEQAAVRRVWQTCKLFDIDPSNSHLPDLLVEWVPRPTFVERLNHPRATLLQTKPEFFRGSDHIRSGFVAASGPAIIGPQRVADLDVLDLAPTFLHILGIPQPSEMIGQVVPEFGGEDQK